MQSTVTSEMIGQAQAAGRQAFADGVSRTPILHPLIWSLTEDLPVGGGSVQIFQAFTRGYEMAADEAIADSL